MARVVALTLEYDGTDFLGFQRQARGRTVQGVLEEALARLLGETTRVIGAGRTDAGVHAIAQVASFACPDRFDDRTVGRALNALLPPDVVVRAVATAPVGFHARFSARSRRYRYTVWNVPWRPALARRYATHVAATLDTAGMAAAGAGLVGERDFAAFAGATGGDEKGTVRRVLDFSCERRDERVVFEVEANAFLPHMVRNFVGTLLEVGRGAMGVEEFSGVLAGRDRRRAGPTAPARGLCLIAVRYDDVPGVGAADAAGAVRMGE